jgi:uncharacterized protein (DUF1810 family)
VDAAFFKHLHGGLEALAFLQADQIGGRHLDVVKDHVAGVGAALAHLLVVFAEADARDLASTMKEDTPPAPLSSGLVRAISVNMPACGALVMKRLVPLTM